MCARGMDVWDWGWQGCVGWAEWMLSEPCGLRLKDVFWCGWICEITMGVLGGLHEVVVGDIYDVLMGGGVMLT